MKVVQLISNLSTFFWHVKVYYYAHYSPPLLPVFAQMNPEHPLILYFNRIHYNIIPSMPQSSKWSLSFRYSHQTHYAFLLFPMHVTCTSHLRTPLSLWRGIQIMKPVKKEWMQGIWSFIPVYVFLFLIHILNSLSRVSFFGLHWVKLVICFLTSTSTVLLRLNVIL